MVRSLHADVTGNMWLLTGQPEGARPDVCYLPKEVGPCRASMERFYFNNNTEACSCFTYGGCPGNANRFDTMAKCEEKCKTID